MHVKLCVESLRHKNGNELRMFKFCNCYFFINRGIIAVQCDLPERRLIVLNFQAHTSQKGASLSSLYHLADCSVPN